MILDPNHIGRGRGNDGFVKVSPERKTISETMDLSQIEKRGSDPSRRASTAGRYNGPRPEWPSRMRAKTSGRIRGPTRYIARLSWLSIVACSGASHAPRKLPPPRGASGKPRRRVKRNPQREKRKPEDGRTDRVVRVKQTGLSWAGRKKQIGKQRESRDNHTNRDPQMAKQPDLQFGDLRLCCGL